MSIGDLKKTVLIEYIANAESVIKANAEMRAARAQMTAEEKSAAAEARAAAQDREAAYRDVVTQMKAEEAQGRAIQKMIDDVEATEEKAAATRKESHANWLQGLANIGLAYNAVKQAATAALEDLEFAAKRARLENAALGVDVDALDNAAHGLLTRTELLTDASRLNNSMVAMSADQMQIAERATVAFTRAGFDNADAHKRVLDAVTDLKTRGLDELGIHLDKSGLSMNSGRDRAELFRRTMKALAAASKDVSDGQDEAGEATERSAVKLKDAWDSVKLSIGKLAESLAPLVEALAKVVGYIAKIVDEANDEAHKNPLGFALSMTGGGTSGKYLDEMGRAGLLSSDNLVRATMMMTGNDPTPVTPLDGDMKGFMAGKYASDSDGWGSDEDSMRGAKGGKKRRTPDNDLSADQYDAQLKATAKEWYGALQFEFLDPMTRAIDALEHQHGDFVDYFDADEIATIKYNLTNMYIAPVKEGIQSLFGVLKDTFDPGGVHTPTVLERMFGKREDLDGYKETWAAMSSTIGSAYSAIVTGSDSVAKATKKATATALEALGKKMLIEGIEYEFKAIVDRDPSEALAGAGLIAGSIAAGVAAHELGGGGGSGSTSPGGATAGGGGAPAVAPAAPAGPQGGTIVIGDSFADDSPYMRQVRAEKMVSLALGASGVRAA